MDLEKALKSKKVRIIIIIAALIYAAICLHIIDLRIAAMDIRDEYDGNVQKEEHFEKKGPKIIECQKESRWTKMLL